MSDETLGSVGTPVEEVEVEETPTETAPEVDSEEEVA